MRLLLNLTCLSLVFATGLNSQAESTSLANLGNFNDYSKIGYAACWGYTAPDGKEYALLGVQTGLSIIDISNAPKLVEAAFVPSARRSDWTEMKTYKNFAYVVKDNAPVGIQIIDLSGLPSSVQVVNTVKDYPNNHTIWIDSNRALMFTMGGDNMGTTIWSLANPVVPKQVGTFDESAYVHDVYVKGNRAYASEIFSKSFSIWDITNPAAPTLISRTRDESAPYVSFHNAWTTEDGKFLFTTEETSGRPVRVWDISDETQPKQVAQYIGPGNLPHNVRVKGHYAHIAHYGGGYRVLDIHDPAHPAEVAFLNVANNVSGFHGVWDVYPFFASGKVIMSSIEQGLFVTEFNGK